MISIFLIELDFFFVISENYLKFEQDLNVFIITGGPTQNWSIHGQ